MGVLSSGREDFRGLRTSKLLVSACIVVLAVAACARAERLPTEHSGYRISIFVDRVDSLHWEATIDLANIGVIAAMTLPMRWGDGRSPFRLDSADYRGLRTEYFALKTLRVDSTKQSVLLGMISDMGGNYPPLESGSGSIARLYFSTRLPVTTPPVLDTTFIAPHNTLQLVTPDVRAIRPDFQPVGTSTLDR